MMSAPTCGWIRTFWNSSGVSGPGLARMCSGTASLPMSCSSAAVLIALDLVLAHAERACHARRVRLYTSDVVRRDLVLRVDRERKRLDRRQVQLGHLLRVAALHCEARAEDAVDAVAEVQSGCRNQHKAGNQPRLAHSLIPTETALAAR